MRSRLAGRRTRWVAAASLLAVGVLIGAMVAFDGDGDSSVPVPSIAADGGDEPDSGSQVGSGGPEDSGAAKDAAQGGGRDEDDEPAEADEPAEPQPVGEPERIEIPAIDVDSEVVPVGLRDDGAMDVPDFGLAGWYTEGPRPGEEGPSTVVAHVDSRSGPDVFARLRDLEDGDEVRVHGEGGTVTFVVESSESAPKDDLPVDRIWGWTAEPTLRLITCDGLFDRSVGHYEDNHIVYLSLASS